MSDPAPQDLVIVSLDADGRTENADVRTAADSGDRTDGDSGDRTDADSGDRTAADSDSDSDSRTDADSGIRADAHEVRRRCADVLYGRGGPELAERLLERYPGCLLVSVRDGAGRCVTLSRTGRRVTVTPVVSDPEHACLASALYGWLVGLSSPPAPATGLRAAGRPRG